MSTLTTLTRMWLTRSFQPFTFTSEYDQELDFAALQNLGLYVHIPFCKSICNFCPYCKELYSPKKCDSYIDDLIREIHLVGGSLSSDDSLSSGDSRQAPSPGQKVPAPRKQVTSLYFGGGTPALAADRLGEIIRALEEHFIITEGIGVELHPDNVQVPVLQTLKDVGVTKISIGIQSFGTKFQSLLGRAPVNSDQLKKALAAVPFETVSMDFIFALPGQTFEDLRSDIDLALSCGANHVAIYPFIDFTFTSSPVKAMAKKEKHRLLDQVTAYCMEKGLRRDSIWTFGTSGTRYSSMTRDNFLGFGCSATTLLKDQFKINTFSVAQYKKRIAEDKLPTALTIRFSLRQRMLYYLFWTAYSTRVRAADFEAFFGLPLRKMYGAELWLARRLGFVTEDDGTYTMTLKGAFYYHYYENFYTLSYIDKMWNLMRQEAFPERLEL